jgi:hypothetical protein
VIFSPTPLTSPTFLTLPVGHKLTIAQQQEWEAFRQTIGVQQPTITPTQPRVSVTIPADQTNAKPVLFDVTLKLK